MEVNENIFRAYDVRGTYPAEVNEEIAYLIGRAFATVFNGAIVVGGDARLSTPALKESLIKGLVDSGATVVDIGMVPTPVTYFACYKLLKCSGVMVTGSHLAKEFNGFKFCDSDGIPIGYDMGLDKVKELVMSKKFREGKGSVKMMQVDDDYLKFIKSLSKVKLDGIKIVVDGANGSAGKLYCKILRECGAEVIELYCEPDGSFPNHTPDPMDKKFIIDLEAKVKENKADIGLAFDGDGDRINMVDDTGKTTNSNHIFSLMVEDMLKENKGGTIVHEVLTSKLVDDVITKNGGNSITWNVGHTLIAKKCFEENAILAGEVSGHYFFKEANYTDDVLIAGLRIIKIIKESGTSLSELVNKYPLYHEYRERVPVKEESKFQFIEDLKGKLSSQGFDIITLDGVRVNFKNGWMIFRPSNTEAKISIACESSDKQEFEKIKQMVGEIVKTIPR